MFRTVVEDAVVDLVGKDEQVVLARDVDDALEDFAGVHRARRVIRIDDDDGLGLLRHLGADILERGVPVVFFVAEVVHRGAARERGRRRPQWIVRHGDEDLVAIVEQRLRRHGNELGDAVAHVDIIDVEGREILQLIARHNRTARRDNALGRGITLGRGQRRNHVSHDDVRRVEAKDGWVTGVELQNGMAVELHALGLGGHRAADVVCDALELVCLIENASHAA